MFERLINCLLPDTEVGRVGKPNKIGLPFLLKLTWVIEVYYLILNWLILQIHWFNIEISQVIPINVQIINDLVLTQFSNYYRMVIFLGIGLCFGGIIMSLYRYFPGVEYSPLMIVYCRYGIHLCPWLFALAITYWVYSKSPNIFIILIILVPGLIQGLRYFVNVEQSGQYLS